VEIESNTLAVKVLRSFLAAVPIFDSITMALPHHRHQSSLEGVIDFSSPQPLGLDQRNRATDIFNQIVAQYEPYQTEEKGHKQITILRVAHNKFIVQSSLNMVDLSLSASA
jgi:hypothetical protein